MFYAVCMSFYHQKCQQDLFHVFLNISEVAIIQKMLMFTSCKVIVKYELILKEQNELAFLMEA